MKVELNIYCDNLATLPIVLPSSNIFHEIFSRISALGPQESLAQQLTNIQAYESTS